MVWKVFSFCIFRRFQSKKDDSEYSIPVGCLFGTLVFKGICTTLIVFGNRSLHPYRKNGRSRRKRNLRVAFECVLALPCLALPFTPVACMCLCFYRTSKSVLQHLCRFSQSLLLLQFPKLWLASGLVGIEADHNSIYALVTLRLRVTVPAAESNSGRVRATLPLPLRRCF